MMIFMKHWAIGNQKPMEATEQILEIGRYQMSEGALVDVGYYEKPKEYNGKFDGKWTGKDGVYSKEDYLSNKNGCQDKAVREYHKIQQNRYMKGMIKKYSGKIIDGVRITPSGIVAGAHLIGAERIKNYLRLNGSVMDNGVKVENKDTKTETEPM